LRRRHTWIKGEWTDDLLFGLLVQEWESPAS
jgi:aminoglycoside 6'-N-acetyltransferase